MTKGQRSTIVEGGDRQTDRQTDRHTDKEIYYIDKHSNIFFGRFDSGTKEPMTDRILQLCKGILSMLLFMTMSVKIYFLNEKDLAISVLVS